jgi:hypothetical protein
MITVSRLERYTLTEWKKRLLRPVVAEESLWHEFIRLLPVPRYKASSEPVPIIQRHSTYDCSAVRQREYRFAFRMGQGMSSFHRQRCPLSKWYLPRRSSGSAVPDHVMYYWLPVGTRSAKRTWGLWTRCKPNEVAQSEYALTTS